MPARDKSTLNNSQGLASFAVIAIVGLCLMGVGWYLYKNGYFYPLGSSPSPITFTKTPSVDDVNSLETKELKDWQSITVKYGQIKFKYPPKWIVRYDPTNPYAIRYIDLFYSGDNGMIGNDPVIMLSIGKEKDLGVQYGERNFNIPALGQGNNAYFSQYNGPTQISFTKDGVSYQFSLNMDFAVKQKLDPGEATNNFIRLAKSLEFTKELNNCDDIVLEQLKDFPESFILVNRHLSEAKDAVAGYWPNIFANKPGMLPPLPPGPYDSSDSSGVSADTNRIFVVRYLKSGQSFKQSDEFIKSVVEVEGSQDLYAPDAKTAIYNVNCPKLLENSKTAEIYTIGHTGVDPFEVNLFGKASNATALWGVSKWDLNLLKKTRNVVYVKRGDIWQEYAAQDFYVSY